MNLPSNGAVTRAPGRIRASDSRFRNAPPQFLYHPGLSANTAYLRGFRRFWCFCFPTEFGSVLARLQYDCSKHPGQWTTASYHSFLPVTLHKHYVARYSPWILAELDPDDRLRPRVGASCHYSSLASASPAKRTQAGHTFRLLYSRCLTGPNRRRCRTLPPLRAALFRWRDERYLRVLAQSRLLTLLGRRAAQVTASAAWALWAWPVTASKKSSRSRRGVDSTHGAPYRGRATAAPGKLWTEVTESCAYTTSVSPCERPPLWATSPIVIFASSRGVGAP